MFPAIQRVEDKYFSSVRHPEPFETKADTERKRGGGSGVLRCSLQAPLCRDVPLFSHSYDATKFKRGILSIRCAIHCARNNPVAKTLRFTRRRFSWLPVDTEFIFHAPLSAVSMFHRLPLILEFSWPRLFRAYGHATCFMILFLDHEIPGNSPLLCLKHRVSKIQETEDLVIYEEIIFHFSSQWLVQVTSSTPCFLCFFPKYFWCTTSPSKRDSLQQICVALQLCLRTYRNAYSGVFSGKNTCSLSSCFSYYIYNALSASASSRDGKFLELF